MAGEILNVVRSRTEPSAAATLVKFALFAAAIAASLLCFWAAIQFFNAWSVLLLFFSGIFTVWAQQAAAEEVHDAVHGKLFQDPLWNRGLALFYSSCLAVSFEGFKRSHLLHHRYFGTLDDPDYPKYCSCPAGPREWALFFLRYFSGIEALKRFFRKKEKPKSEESVPGQFKIVLLVQALLFLIALLSGVPFWYAMAWIGMLVTVNYGITHLRTLMEHYYMPEGAARNPGMKIGALYNLEGWFSSNVMAGQYGYNFHGTHHHYPNVPNFRLSEVSACQKQTEPAKVFHLSYLQRIKELMFQPKPTLGA